MQENTQSHQGWQYQTLTYRQFFPYGKTVMQKSHVYLLNYGRKVLINTGVIETFADVKALLASAGLNWKDIDMVINTAFTPDRIGANALVQREAPGAVFFSHPADRAYIENVALLEEDHPQSGFFKLVAGNTDSVRMLSDGAVIPLDGDTLHVRHSRSADGGLELFLQGAGIWLDPDGPVERWTKASPLHKMAMAG